MTDGSLRPRAVALGLLGALGGLPAFSAGAPVLDVVAAPDHAGASRRIAEIDPRRLAATMRWVGLESAGPPIRVVVAAEGSPEARLAPPWSAGYAFGEIGQVVVMPRRIPGYPHDSLETVVLHEVAHVLIARAAGRRPVPRWFNEGLAMVAAREWSLRDRGQLVLGSLTRRGHSLAELDQRFAAGPSGARRAYAMAGAFVRDLVERHGRRAPAAILAAIARGASFEAAFSGATGLPLEVAEARFWRHLDLWHRWLPFLTSSTFLWMAVTGLALLSFRRRRQRDRELRERWEHEEGRSVDEPPAEWIH